MDADAWKRLGETVRRRRTQLGLSQGQVPPSAATWRKVENAVEYPYAERTVMAICSALRWEPDSFDRILAGEPPVELDGGTDDPDLKEVIRDLAEQVRLLRSDLRSRGTGEGAQ